MKPFHMPKSRHTAFAIIELFMNLDHHELTTEKSPGDIPIMDLNNLETQLSHSSFFLSFEWVITSWWLPK